MQMAFFDDQVSVHLQKEYAMYQVQEVTMHRQHLQVHPKLAFANAAASFQRQMKPRNEINCDDGLQ